MVRQAHQPWFDKITILYIRYTSSREIRYAKKGAAGAGRARQRRVAEQSGAMEANAGSRNEVSSDPASATHGKCPATKKQMDSKAKRRHTKNTGINFGIVSKEKVSTCKFTSIIVEYIQRTFRKNLPTFLL